MGRVLRTGCHYKCHNLLAIAAIDMIIMVLWTSHVAEAKLVLSEGERCAKIIPIFRYNFSPFML